MARLFTLLTVTITLLGCASGCRLFCGDRDLPTYSAPNHLGDPVLMSR